MEHEALQDQKLEDELQSVTYKLVAHLICSENKCTNYRRSCYVQSKGAIHQVADSRAIRLWSRAIMRKEATLESPPMNVVLRPLDQTRRAKGNTSQESDSTTPSVEISRLFILSLLNSMSCIKLHLSGNIVYVNKASTNRSSARTRDEV